MKKRIFIPVSISFFLFDVIFFAFAGVPLYLIIEDIKEKSFTHDSFIMILAFIYLFYVAVRFLFGPRIHMNKDAIKMYGDGSFKFERIQFKTNIMYKDIKSVKIIFSDKNSLNKPIHTYWPAAMSPKKYLEFTLMNDRKKRLCIIYYNKRQVRKILNYININMQYHNNENKLDIETIMQDWCTLIGYKPPKKQKVEKSDEGNS